MQEIFALVIVALAAVYTAWKLMPRALRARLAQATVAAVRRRGRLSDDQAAALARRLTAGGCGSCDDCGGCGPERAGPANASALRFVPSPSRSDRSRR
jgi:hypothetical protein